METKSQVLLPFLYRASDLQKARLDGTAQESHARACAQIRGLAPDIEALSDRLAVLAIEYHRGSQDDEVAHALTCAGDRLRELSDAFRRAPK